MRRMGRLAVRSIDEYIARFPLDVRKALERLRTTIRSAAPEAKETIKYGMPTFTLDGNLVYFAAYKAHIGFYPGASAIRKFKHALRAYDCAKGTVRFPMGTSIPVGSVTRMTKFRVKENRERAQARAKKKNAR